MRRVILCFLGFTAVSGMTWVGTLTAQEKVAAQRVLTATDTTTPKTALAPPSGARADLLDRLDYYEKRFLDLAGAVPAEKYTWRPGEGVRSISEVYLHVAAANFNLPRLLGTQPPAGLDIRSLEKSTTDKTKVIQTVKDSFAHIREAVQGLSEADETKTVKLFGGDRTYRYVFVFIVGHLGEHLGQSIAYARMNGIVPPWTEEQQRQQQQAKPAEKPKP